ncbi:hypothetical protein OU787_17345 [Kitasatospora sp. YST-16]|uniref:hypothetical protein n=1 Tax=Kitasatospora sp. YST-16 TaxID=2998080 RepID=UPI0022849923|nr:hypothetical protein [Kitasatospora sp. YST-16]WAL73115.1 hypothetical protein OU787_17345 [Kitasatospora sp. YST-16]WNW39169.1 hypothetical protein RKE32_17310 [Streptomyces sp. Li-HN-5-13]
MAVVFTDDDSSGGMMQYRILFVEFVSGDIWGELPAVEVGFSRVLNAPGEGSVKIPLTGPAVRGLPWQALQPWRVLVYVQAGEQILWGGPLVTYAVDLSAETMTLNLQGLWAYYRRRYISEDRTFLARDQTLIARDLIKDFGDGTGNLVRSSGPKALTFDDNYLSGVARDRSYWRYEWKTVGQVVEDLAALTTGFDFRIDHFWQSGRIVNRLVFGPPTGDPTDFVLEHGANCTVPGITADGTSVTTEAVVTGAGDGADQLVSTWYDLLHETDGSRRIPRLTSVQSRVDVTVPDTLTGYAQQMISEGSVPVVIPAVQLYPDAFPGVGDLQVGQLATVRAKVGDWPGYSGRFKVTEITHKVSDNGASETRLALAPAEVFASVGSAAIS